MFQLLLVLAVALATALMFGKTGSWKKIAAIGLLVYPAIIAANVATYWWFFIKVEAWLRDAGWGVNPYLLKAATGALTFLLTAIAPAAIGALVKSRKWAFATVSVGSYCAMNLFLFAVSRPQPGQVSNPNNGEPLYKYYRDPVGNCVERFPRHYEFHPDHIGVRLLLPDDKIVQEWRSHPCRTDASEAAPRPTPSSEARHEAALDAVHFTFESCNRLDADIVCTIAATNDDRDDRTVTWKHNVVTTDNEGNVHYASQQDVGGRWEWDSFFGINPHRCEECDFTSLLMAHVVTRFHARFENVTGTVNALQNLRVSICCAGPFSKDVDLNFTGLAIMPERRSETVTSVIETSAPTFGDGRPEQASATDVQACEPDARFALRVDENGRLVRVVQRDVSRQIDEQGTVPAGDSVVESEHDPVTGSSAAGTSGCDMRARLTQREEPPLDPIPVPGFAPRSGPAPQHLAEPESAPRQAQDRTTQVLERVKAACGVAPEPQATALERSRYLWCRFDVVRGNGASRSQ